MERGLLGLKKHDAGKQQQACRVGISGPAGVCLALTQPADKRPSSLNGYVMPSWETTLRAQATPKHLILHMARDGRRRPGELYIGTCLGYGKYIYKLYA